MAAATGTISGVGLAVLVFGLFLMIPALVLTLEAVRGRASIRGELAGSSIDDRRSLVGRVVLLRLAHAGRSERVVLRIDALFGGLGLVAVGGAGFALLAFDSQDRRAGRDLIVVALAVTVVVILGSIWMSGRWGAAS